MNIISFNNAVVVANEIAVVKLDDCKMNIVLKNDISMTINFPSSNEAIEGMARLKISLVEGV